jgi:eukaryotic-like serine/threonine-protein kinase
MLNAFKRILLVAAMLVIGLLASGPYRAVLAQEPTTAEWPMFRGNPARTGSMPGMGPEGPPVELWRFQAEGGIASTPAVVDGVVYIGCDCDRLYAIDATTGNELWHVQQGESFATNPAVVDGVVYASNGDGNLYAFNAPDGTERWHVAGSRSLAGPAVLDGVVYTGGE